MLPCAPAPSRVKLREAVRYRFHRAERTLAIFVLSSIKWLERKFGASEFRQHSKPVDGRAPQIQTTKNNLHGNELSKHPE
jgi:hypothetical protein